MDINSKAQYRRIRNGWGLVLALVWVVYRWLDLHARHEAAVAGLDRCTGILHSIGCSMSHSAADGGFAGGVLLAILVSPLALVVTHYFARWRVERDEQNVAREHEQRESARLTTQRHESDARLEAVARDAQRAHRNVDRSDFIHKLGAVSDFLDLLVHETDTARIANIRLGAAQALRDLVAKHTIDQLAVLIRADKAVAVSLTAILARLDATSFDAAPEVHILRAALNEAIGELAG